MSNLWLRQLFQNDGLILDTFIPYTLRIGKDTRFGFVRFQKEDQASHAINRNNGLLIKGQKLEVKWAKYARNTHIKKKGNSHQVPTPKQKVWKPAQRDTRSYKEVVQAQTTLEV